MGVSSSRQPKHKLRNKTCFEYRYIFILLQHKIYGDESTSTHIQVMQSITHDGLFRSLYCGGDRSGISIVGDLQLSTL